MKILKFKAVIVVFYLLLVNLCAAQQLQRSTLGNQGISKNISINNNVFLVQQSIGQVSVIGKFQSEDFIVRQGFIQPPLILSELLIEETTLLAVIYPVPFDTTLYVSFNEKINKPLNIRIYDLLGRVVFQDNRKASQKININLIQLASARYILNITSGNKQIKANLIKR